MWYFCNFKQKGIVYEEELIDEILQSEEYVDMDVYPVESSIRFINDTLVVKFKRS